MKKTVNRIGMPGLALVVGLTIAACQDGRTEPLHEPAALLSVTPRGGATDVGVATTVMVRFDHAIHDHMTAYAALHEGDVNGPDVPGTWALSEDGTVLSFSPDAPLEPATQYTIHLGGGMTDAQGRHVNLENNGMDMGGEWATGSMMSGGMDGMMDGRHPHMGDGWQHPSNGSYGMLFTFMTAS